MSFFYGCAVFDTCVVVPPVSFLTPVPCFHTCDVLSCLKLFLNSCVVFFTPVSLFHSGAACVLQVVYANQEASGLRLSVNGNTCVFTKEYDPACLDTDVAGKLARRVVADGARVKQGDVSFFWGGRGGAYSYWVMKRWRGGER